MSLNYVSDLFTEVYHFSVGISGLAYLGLGVGFIIASVFSAKMSSQIYRRVRAWFLLKSLT